MVFEGEAQRVVEQGELVLEGGIHSEVFDNYVASRLGRERDLAREGPRYTERISATARPLTRVIIHLTHCGSAFD